MHFHSTLGGLNGECSQLKTYGEEIGIISEWGFKQKYNSRMAEHSKKEKKFMNHKVVKCHTDQDADHEISNEMFQESSGTA